MYIIVISCDTRERIIIIIVSGPAESPHTVRRIDWRSSERPVRGLIAIMARNRFVTAETENVPFRDEKMEPSCRSIDCPHFCVHPGAD